MIEIEIKWTGPFGQEEVKGKKGDLYQFYGHHFPYGENVLLYICRDDDCPGDISDHNYLNKEKVASCFKPEIITVRVGKIPNKKGRHIKTIEGMLIFRHSPAWNSDRISESRECYRNIKIENKNEKENENGKGDLLEIVSGEDCFP